MRGPTLFPIAVGFFGVLLVVGCGDKPFTGASTSKRVTQELEQVSPEESGSNMQEPNKGSEGSGDLNPSVDPKPVDDIKIEPRLSFYLD